MSGSDSQALSASPDTLSYTASKPLGGVKQESELKLSPLLTKPSAWPRTVPGLKKRHGFLDKDAIYTPRGFG